MWFVGDSRGFGVFGVEVFCLLDGQRDWVVEEFKGSALDRGGHRELGDDGGVVDGEETDFVSGQSGEVVKEAGETAGG